MSETVKSTNDVKIPSDNKYVVLCETSGEEMESWYYFIRYGDNKDSLEFLQKQLESIDMYIIDELSTFDLDLEHFFSESTAKEMIRLEVNTIYHRKFDGKLDLVNFNFKKRDDNDNKIEKMNDLLGGGSIDNYIDNEDTDGCSNYNSDNETLSDGSFSSDEEDTKKDEEEEDLFSVPCENKNKNKKDQKSKIPSSIMNTKKKN